MSEYTMEVLSDPPHDCREGFPNPPGLPVGTVAGCTKLILKNGLRGQCGRKWIVWPGARGWFGPDRPPYWKEETYEW